MSEVHLVGPVLTLALGVLGLISTLLLKLGKLKPGSRWAFGTVLGGLFMIVGFFVGLRIEEKAHKARKAYSQVSSQ